MESLSKHMSSLRVRFSGVGEEHKEDVGRQQRIPVQKTQSFKGEKKKGQNWLQRQFSRQMSRDGDLSYSKEYPTAVAAAVFAVRSLEESRIQDQKKMDGGPADTSLPKTRSKTQDSATTPSRKLTGDVSLPNLEVPDRRVRISSITDEIEPDKPAGPAPSIKKTPTLKDKPSSRIAGEISESAVAEKVNLSAPTVKKGSTFADKLWEGNASERPQSELPRTDLPPSEIQRESPEKLEIGDGKADVWEREKMLQIKERYEKLIKTIDQWEDKNKAKAKKKINRTQANLDKKRAKAWKNHHSNLKMIDEVSAGARAKAEENRRNEELKVKEKAERIRTTGKLPATCSCF